KLLDPPDERFAMRVFNYSIIYLMALFAFMLVDHYIDSTPLRRTVMDLHRIG
ncbi:MAG: protoheme IX farnesyltransferase, partial [Proteobacteria bacterium]|nr:protoheme IX farnesyltransferase [Pseudomonadota bacterium]